MNIRQPSRLAGPALLLLTLAACCGSGGGGNDGAGTPSPPLPPAPAGFAAETGTWTVELPAAGSAVCYDFDAGAEAACDEGTAWDIKIAAGARGNSLWTNGGVTNAAGSGAAFGFLDWAELSTWVNATTEPGSNTDISLHYTADSDSSIFSSKSWYAYNLEGTHKLYPNYRVYLINADPADTESTVWALQVIGYYGGVSGTASGNPTIRWIDRDHPDDVRTQEIDATAQDQWVYFDLANGAVVDLADADARESDAWHVAFRRDKVKLNGGSSTAGPGTVAGFLGKELPDFYDAEGDAINATFLAATPDGTLAALTGNEFTEPASASAWVRDSQTSVLNPAYSGSYPNPLDYGFYIYYPNGDTAQGIGRNQVAANADSGVLIRSGGGDSYARLRLVDVTYADPSSATSQQTWTFEFNLQPAP